MKIGTKIFALAALPLFIFSRCTSKGDLIGQSKFGTYQFNTYTEDTFRFRVILNEEVLTDSLLSPRSSFSKVVNFFNPTARLLVLDAGNHNQVVLDSVIQTKIGTTKISIVQFQHGEKPGLPPLPNEAPPAAGNFKVRFQYAKPTNPLVVFVDPVKCIVQKDGIPVDTVDLVRYGLTPFYEGKANTNFFKVRLEYPNFTQLSNGNTVSQTLGGDYSGFNTAIVYGVGTNTNPNTFTYKLEYAY